MRIAILTGGLMVGLALGPGEVALGIEPAPKVYHYRIHHQIFGDIGEHRIVVSQDGDRVVVEHAAQLAVKLLNLTAFERRSRYREVWEGLRLVAFDGLTVDNGERSEVRAQGEDDRLIVEGSAGRTLAPPATVPSQPSLAGRLAGAAFIDVKTGRLLEARVTDAGPETLHLARGPVEVERYEVTGELEEVVWYDAEGVFVQWRLWRQGAAITLTRE